MEDHYKTHGAFSWSELMTTNAEAAIDFYTRLFGWQTEKFSMEGMDYTVVKVGEEAIGGIMATPPDAEGTPPHWGTYVTVDNVDATVRNAEELGGNIVVPPRDIPDVGRFAVIQDPQGALVSVITYQSPA